MDCPAGFICFNSQTLGLLFAMIILFLCYQAYHSKRDLKTLTEIKEEKIENAFDIVASSVESPKIRNNIYIVERDNTIPITPSTMLVNKDYERIINPLLPPERSYDNVYRVPINIPTRGFSENYQQVGVIGEDERILPLYGRPLWKGANKWNYYTNTDGFQSVKLPTYFKGRDCMDDQVGCDEIYDGDQVKVPQLNKEMKATMYKYDKPRYIPWI